MRGKAALACLDDLCHGITPAYAGKSPPPLGKVSYTGDHPRVCGEKAARCSRLRRGVGSPPRMRGKGRHENVSVRSTRITPAYAGKRKWRCRTTSKRGDHPRVCGEKSSVLPSLSPGTGSPPRMRGKVGCADTVYTGNGITPAYAGKRLKRSHSIGHFSCILCLFHSVLHRASVSGGSRAGPCAPPCLPAQNAVPV